MPNGLVENIQDWSDVTATSLKELWSGFIGFIPKLIGALIVFIIGWIIAVWVGKLVTALLKKGKFDKVFEKTKWDSVLEKADMKMGMSGLIGGIVKWILAIVFLGAAINILGWTQFGAFVSKVVAWLPNLLIAAAIFVVAAIVADFAEKLAKAIVGKMNVGYTSLVGAIVRWAIWIFAIFAILDQLGVQGFDGLIQIIVGAIMLALALAFGLGGREVARDFLGGLKAKIRD